jgi:hypothetical protein
MTRTAARIGLGILSAWAVVALAVPVLPLRDPGAQPDGLVLRNLPPLSRVSAVRLRDGSLRYAHEVRPAEDGGRDLRRGETWTHIPPQELSHAKTLEGPPLYLLGTDAFGRDLFSRLLWGARVSLAVGLLAAAVALGIGGSIGLIAGLAGGAVDGLLMRVTDAALAIPRLFLLVLLAALFRPSLGTTVLLVGATTVDDGGAARPQRGALDPRPRFRRRGLVGRSLAGARRGAPRPAARGRGARGGSGHASRPERASRGLALVPWPRRTASGRVVGRADRRRPGPDAGRVVDRGLAGARDRHRGAGGELGRRRLAREFVIARAAVIVEWFRTHERVPGGLNVSPTSKLAAALIVLAVTTCPAALAQEAPPATPPAPAAPETPAAPPPDTSADLQQAKDAFKKGTWVEAADARSASSPSIPSNSKHCTLREAPHGG